jgi:hypothetical protein
MIIATLAALFLFFGGSILPFTHTLEVTTKQVKKVVPDGIQREHALAILKQMEEVAKQDRKNLEEFEKAVDTLAARRDATRQEFKAAYETLEPQQTAAVEKEIALRFQLKDTLSREEWGKVFPPASSAQAPATAKP